MSKTSLSERNQIIEYYLAKRKEGQDNSSLRKDMLKNEISAKNASNYITEIDRLYTIPKYKSILDFIKKSHARIRIIIGMLTFFMGLIILSILYVMEAPIKDFKAVLILMIAGIGTYSSGVYSLRKANRENKKFNASLKPIERDFFWF